MTPDDVLLSLVLLGVLGLTVYVNSLNQKIGSPKELNDKAVEVRALADGLSREVSALRGDVSNIREHSARIAQMSESYDKTEQKVQTIYSILIGSYSKGRTGEQLLKNMMADLVRAGFVESGARFGTQVVEYAVRLPDGKILGNRLESGRYL